jgi:selenocysteine lyase/cysteine desulfurase
MENNEAFTPWSRRSFLSLITGISATGNGSLNFPNKPDAIEPSALPAKDMFSIKGTYLNAAYTHPMSLGSYHEVTKFLNARMMNGDVPNGYDAFERASVIAAFAKLINALPEEIALVPSTMVGENLIVSGLGLPGSKEHIVTDGLHFEGSLFLYGELEKQGLHLTVVKPRDKRIDLNDLDAAIKPGTKLVSVSLVSTVTGFSHDLKKLCQLAHSRGALVFADIIQAAGAVPIDVKDSQVDFCSCATYKWLMGDFGLGFLYVRKESLPRIKRTLIGYRQMKSYSTHIFPYDPPGNDVFDAFSAETMSGHFEVGTFANEGIVALRYSLDYLNRIGVDKIYECRKPMIDKLQKELPSDTYIPMTPSNAYSPIVSFACKDAVNRVAPKIKAADINISVYENRIRISPSFYNDMDEIDRLIAVLKTV